MKIAIGCDHAGPALKMKISDLLAAAGHTVVNKGTDTLDSVDYPDFAHAVAREVSDEACDLGILICGSANGVAMSANKHQNIRAAIAWTPEIAMLARQHNDANILCIPARFVSEKGAYGLVESFLSTDFEGGRHTRRVGKIACAMIALVLGLFGFVQAQEAQWTAGAVVPAMSAEATEFAATITADELREHLTVFSSDAFEGRETGQPGADRAAAYVANHFKQLGIAPLFGESYYQDVPFIRSKITGAAMEAGDQSFELLEDFYFFPGLKTNELRAPGVVFVGHGIQTDGWDDYAGGEIEGMVVLVMPGTPMDKKGNTRLSSEEEAERWSDGIQAKRDVATAMGAAAIVFVQEDFKLMKGRMKPWLLSERLILDRAKSGESHRPQSDDGEQTPALFVSEGAANRLLLAGGETSLKKWKRAVTKKGILSPVEMELNFTLDVDRGKDRFNGVNVLGYIPGSDSALANEVLVITAHYDHIGIIDGEIHNGADDDGSGTVTVLELAEAFVAARNAGFGPRRSVLLMTVVGEEKGLLGSEWYSDHPVFPLEQTVANLNVDMVGRVDDAHLDDNRYVYLIGSDKLSTELHAVSERMNSESSNLALDYTFNAPDDPNRFYYRSDHYNFAKHDIPVIFYFSGVHEDYHGPGDDAEKVMYDKTAEIGRLIFHTAWQLTQQDGRIQVDVKNDFPTDR